MANLKEIRNRIASVSSTMQITSAMKMVSAAKLKKAQDAITAMRPYSDTLTDLLQSLSSNIESSDASKYALVRPEVKILLVAITSNRGLCGAFNTNIIKRTQQLANVTYVNASVSVMAIGKKAADILGKTLPIVANESAVYEDLNYVNVSEIAERLMLDFSDGTYDKIILVYNKFKNAATQEVMTEQFLPIVPVVGGSQEADYIFEPSKEEIVSELVPKALKTQLFKGIRDSFASEHGARMTAMHKATDNATEMRDQLKLTYNKARQASITNEILEIVGGAEALKE
ncbi:MAG: ATP synthase F1 subunit gamma [Flavobacteriaceae bacterium]|tara:strand:- start:6984 stop:7841 length:858 start_codon:yes stop_codon:yes gene_type:complete